MPQIEKSSLLDCSPCHRDHFEPNLNKFGQIFLLILFIKTLKKSN